jgi:nucleotidyltransferase/DNA polymerase involved in DNA repair
MVHQAEISQQIRGILISFRPLVEPLSLDEAFLDVHRYERLFGPVQRPSGSLSVAGHLASAAGNASQRFNASNGNAVAL